MQKTVCIIGAGIGGLTAGLYLAKAGYQVIVFEKARSYGGSAGWYVRNDRTFPAGATIAFGLEEDGILKQILDELQVPLVYEELVYPMDVVLPDRRVSIFKNRALWEEELARKFPDKKEQVLLFWRELSKIGNDVLGITKTRASLPVRHLYDLGELPKFAFTNPQSLARAGRYAHWTVGDLLKKYNLDTCQPFRQLLDAQLLDAVQTDTVNAALLPASLALTIYRNGSFHIKKGMGSLSNAMAVRLAELGGQILTSTSVKSLSYDSLEQGWQVFSKKGTAFFHSVINTAGISFGPGTSYSGQETSWGAFRIDAVLPVKIKSEVLKNRPLPFAMQIVTEGPLLNFNMHGPVYVTFQQALDGEGRIIPEEIAMSASVHTACEPWGLFSREEYKMAKEQVKRKMIAEIERALPIKDYIKKVDAGSPETYRRYIGKAEVGGFPLTVKNAILKPKSVGTSLPQFYIAGEQAFPGPGTLSAALSGYFAARAVMNDKTGVKLAKK